MLYEEFLNRVEYVISCNDYHNIVEPVYNRIYVDKDIFCEIFTEDMFNEEKKKKVQEEILEILKEYYKAEDINENFLDIAEVIDKETKAREITCQFVNILTENVKIKVPYGVKVRNAEDLKKFIDSKGDNCIIGDITERTEEVNLVYKDTTAKMPVTDIVNRNNTLEYKGFYGEVFIDEGSHLLYGKVVNSKDLISFEGRDVSHVVLDFHQAVDAYIKMKEDECYV